MRLAIERVGSLAEARMKKGVEGEGERVHDAVATRLLVHHGQGRVMLEMHSLLSGHAALV